MFCIPCFAYVSADERLCCAYCKMWIAKQALEAQRCGQAPPARLCLWILVGILDMSLRVSADFVVVTSVRELCLLYKCLFPSFFASPLFFLLHSFLSSIFSTCLECAMFCSVLEMSE